MGEEGGSSKVVDVVKCNRAGQYEAKNAEWEE